MKMNEKIKQLRLKRGLTLEQVGDYVGVGKATVLKWENGFIQNMRRDKIAKLAYILGTTPDFLIGWESKPDEWTKSFCESVENELTLCDHTDIADSGVDYGRLSEVASGVNSISLSEACNIADELGRSLDEMVGKENPSNSSPYGYKSGLLPVVGVASAGKGVFAEQDIIEWMEAPSDCCDEEHFWVKIVGASMEPEIFSGDYVLIRRQEELENGNIGLFVIADEGFCKRYRHEEGFTELISSNPSFPPMRFVNGCQNTIRIIGRVIRLNRTL